MVPRKWQAFLLLLIEAFFFPPATLASDTKHNYWTISGGKRQTLILPSEIARLIATAIDTRPL